MNIKHFVAAPMILLVISSSESRSGFAVDVDASSRQTNQLKRAQLELAAIRDDGKQSASLPAPDAEILVSISPYEIKQHIEEHQKDEYLSLKEEEFWQRLGVNIEEWNTYRRCCEVAIFELALGSGEDKNVMLRLYDPSGWSGGDTHFLFFKPIATGRQTEWRFLGHIDFEDQRYEAPEHRVITSGAARWLVLTILAGRGSGYGRHSDEWYEVDDNGVRLVLSYPSSKFLSSWDSVPLIEASSEVVGATTEPDRTSLMIEFTVSYSLDSDALPDGDAPPKDKIDLWTKTQRAIFVRNSSQERFSLDDRQSQISNEELDAVFGGEGPSNDEILRYNIDHLERIATGSNEHAKEWLRSYLSKLKNTTEKERLLKNLLR